MGEESRVERFKKAIGFELLASGGGGRGDVVFEWPDLETGAGLRDGGWRRLVDFVTSDAPGEGYRVQKARNDRGTFTVEIHVSSSGSRTARERLVELAGRTMTVDIPYVAGPTGLGDLAITHVNPKVPTLIWVYANVCVSVDADDSGVDLLVFARDLQRQMESHLGTVASEIPRIAELVVDPSRLHVGDEARVTVRLASKQPDAVFFKVEDPDDRLSLAHEDANVFRFSGKTAGTSTLRATVIDRKTLLSASSSAVVVVSDGMESKKEER
ncbi:MAG: hypothetical protein ABI768_00180 [Acidobacteriota bacterium]